MRCWVYMLECADGRYYVGSYRGVELEDRVGEHNAGKYRDAWTYGRRPVTLVWCEEFQLALHAIAVERQLKGWCRAKKEAVIRGDWSALRELAKSYTDADTPRPSTGSG